MAKTLVYQLYPLSWRTGFGGMKKHLERIAALGVDYVWLSPIFRSPCEDGGYDVSNYKEINSQFGKGKRNAFDQFEEFVDAAHHHDLGVLLDLPINHTSVRHRWFDTHPEYYCWSPRNRSGWHNLFNGGPAWEYSNQGKSFYLHLFHQTQADLNWFPLGDDQLNESLVNQFQNIIQFWLDYEIDGFRLDFPQGINKDFASDTLALENLIFGYKAVDVINAIFRGHEDSFIIMEGFDPTMGGLTEYYADRTPVDFFLNVFLKDEIKQGKDKFLELVGRQTQNSHFMLDLESHDSPRFPSRGVPPEKEIWWMFDSNAEGICLYQGQELGLNNPTPKELPDSLMFQLDAQTSMRFIRGENIDELRPLSRANARLRLPLDEYKKQEQDPDSYLNLTKDWIQRWRQKRD